MLFFLTDSRSSKSTQDSAWESGRLQHMIQWIPATRGTWQRPRVQGQSKEFEDWCHILTNSLGTEPDAAWDLLSNAHSPEKCLADPKLPRGLGTRPGKLATVLGRDPLKQAGEQCSALWPAMRDLFPI